MDINKTIERSIYRIKGDYFSEKDNLITNGLISSFELVMLIGDLEKEFGIRIPLEMVEPEAFNSIDSISELINLLLTGMDANKHES